MARSFASGLIWGLVIVGGGLAVISHLAPLPMVAPVSSPATQTAPAADSATSPVAQPTPASLAAGLAGTAPAPGMEAMSAAPAVTATEPIPGLRSSDKAAPNPDQAAVAQSGTAPKADAGSAQVVPPATVSPNAAGEAQTAESPQTASLAQKTASPAQTAAPVRLPASAALGAAPQTPGTDPAALSRLAPPALAGSAPDAARGTDQSVAQSPVPKTDGMIETPAPAPPLDAASGAAVPAKPEADSAALPASPPLAGAQTGNTAPGTMAELTPEPPVPGGSPDTLGASTELALPQAPAAVEAAPALDALGAALTAPSADQQPASSEVPAPEPVGPKDSLLVPGQGAGLAEPSRLPQIAATEDPGLAPQPLPQIAPPVPGDAAPAQPQALAPHILVPDTPALPGTQASGPKGLTSTLPTVLKPAQLTPAVPGVQTNALPQIGVTPEPEAAVSVPQDDKPIKKFARAFKAVDGKPLFAILLKDVGGAGMNRTELAKLPFPVTFVVDPLATDAKIAAETYRQAGQEVLMLANGLPDGATAGDVAETFQTLQGILPEAVGVIDQDTLGFQDNRALATMVLPVIADQGRGLVTYGRGLNAADQIARHDGLPAAVVFRRLDGAGESQPTIRRYLDRAVFKAAQEGAVVVLGDTRADTVAAILQWTIEGKASTVDLAPISAVMGRK